MCKNLRTFASLVANAKSPSLVYAGETMGTLQGVEVCSDGEIPRLTD